MSNHFAALDSIFSQYGVGDWSYSEDSLAQSYQNFIDWVREGSNGPLSYLEDHRMVLREDIKKFYPEFQSALVFLFPYTETRKQLDDIYNSNESNGLRIASYTLGFNGEDYHIELSQRLNKMAEEVKAYLESRKLLSSSKSLEWNLSVDIHPVLERDLAYRSGLGWFGKNSMLINRKLGSFTLIGAIFFNQRLPSSVVPKRSLENDHCGQCRACVDACPTEAIDISRRQIIAQNCISTYTIELFKDAPVISGHKENSHGEIFGCDICQDVCPWNFKPLAKESGLDEKPFEFSLQDQIVESFLKTPIFRLYENINSLSNRGYIKKFLRTSFSRTGRKGMLKNLNVFLSRK